MTVGVVSVVPQSAPSFYCQASPNVTLSFAVGSDAGGSLALAAAGSGGASCSVAGSGESNCSM